MTDVAQAVYRACLAQRVSTRVIWRFVSGWDENSQTEVKSRQSNAVRMYVIALW